MGDFMGWRKEYAKNLCLKFEPAAANGSVAWNPLDEIRVGTENEVLATFRTLPR